MNILLFVAVICVSFIVVRIGAAAFHLTGPNWEQAKFQALSCFTSTGFTTKESELITCNAKRRKIATALIILGNAGLVTLIATFANSLRPWVIVEGLDIPFLSKIMISGVSPWINLAIILLALYLLYRFVKNSGLIQKTVNYISSRFLEKHLKDTSTIEEISIAPQGYVVAKIPVPANSALANKKIRDIELDETEITVLALIREEQTISNPSKQELVLPGDEFVCFGTSWAISEAELLHCPE